MGEGGLGGIGVVLDERGGGGPWLGEVSWCYFLLDVGAPPPLSESAFSFLVLNAFGVGCVGLPSQRKKKKFKKFKKK